MTFVSRKHQFIFLKTRKTAGTSVSALLMNLYEPGDLVAVSKDISLSRTISNSRIKFNSLPLMSKLRHINVLRVDIVRMLLGKITFDDVSILPRMRQHMSAKEVRTLVGDDCWRRYTKISISRNPYDRLVSLYKWRQYRFNVALEFEDFVKAAIDSNHRYHKYAYGFDNSEFYSSTNDYYEIDEFIRFENLRDDLIKLNDKYQFGLKISSLPMLKSNVGDSSEYLEYYTPAILDLVRDNFRKECKFFNYELR